MDALLQLPARDACLAVIARYCHLCDAQDYAGFAALFTEDALWSRPIGDFRGRTAIRAVMEERPSRAQTRHVMGSIHVQVDDADHASALSYCTVYRDLAWSGEGPALLEAPEMLVDYRDRFVRVDGRWLIASRHTTMVFQRPR